MNNDDSKLEPTIEKNSFKKNIKIITKCVSVALLILLIFSDLIGKKTENTPDTPNNKTKKGYTLTYQENKILDVTLNDEADGFSRGKDALLSNEQPSASVVQIAQAYDENQVAADEKYYNKLLFIS